MLAYEYQALRQALLWHIDAGADFPWSDEPGGLASRASIAEESVKLPVAGDSPAAVQPPLGMSEARIESARLAAGASSLDDLRAAIAGFDGIGLKSTATNLVFGSGLPTASVMVVGDAPGADDDRTGQPFAGKAGALLDRILASVGLSRGEQDPEKAVYITNILNWRPPGNRSPTQAEIETSLPFIERHIQLVNPRMVIAFGAVPAQALLGKADPVSRLRGRWFDYMPRALPAGSQEQAPIPLIATYHPASLLQTPGQKRQVWMDMLEILEKRKSL